MRGSAQVDSEILRKLGWGMNASVWLARDHVQARYVAIKALKGMTTDLACQGELPIMERVTELAGQPEYCTTLLSDFIHVGKPNDGQHLCFVMNVLTCDVETLRAGRRALPPPLVKLILRDSLRGLAQLHGSGCAHTGRLTLMCVISLYRADLKASNIMCNLPELTTEDKLQVLITTTPSRRHPPERSWDYLVEAAVSQPLPPPTLEQALSGSFMLADFGSAQMIDHQVTSTITPETLRAPEVIMRRPWGTQVDIWTFGCLCTNSFSVITSSRRDIANPEHHLLAQMRAITGEKLPAGLEILPDILDQYLPTPFARLFEEKARVLGIPEHDIAGAIDLMTRCLRIDPTIRHLLNWLGAVRGCWSWATISEYTVVLIVRLQVASPTVVKCNNNESTYH
ncbi:kinase-like domain-containing protein, partial [Mycena rebaudengoi]